jgi:hypothetical protein
LTTRVGIGAINSENLISLKLSTKSLLYSARPAPLFLGSPLQNNTRVPSRYTHELKLSFVFTLRTEELELMLQFSELAMVTRPPQLHRGTISR